LPDVVNPPEIAVPSEAATAAKKKAKDAGVVSKSEAAQKRQYEELKERFEPGFGELRTPAKSTPGGATAKQGSYNDRYRRLLEQASREQVAPESAATPLGGASAAPSLSGTEVPGASMAAPGSAPGSAANAGRSGRGGRPSTWQGPLQPPLISPFAQRPAVEPSGQMSPRANPNLQSPFQQNVPGATGFTPASPFGTQARQQATPVVRPFGGNAPNRYSNPAVRPANPRDYVP
jgi:hypothetical protein